jgi:hypothetical protein
LTNPEAMTDAAIHAELRHLGVTERLLNIVVRELNIARERAEQDGGDPEKATWAVLRRNIMALPDNTLTRRGDLFVTLMNRQAEEYGEAA